MTEPRRLRVDPDDPPRSAAADAGTPRASERLARGVEGLLGIALVGAGCSAFDWRLGLAAAGALLYVSASWGRA